MQPLQRLGEALDALWSSIDVDEPLLCDCSDGFTCPDCALATPLDTASPWPEPAPRRPAA